VPYAEQHDNETLATAIKLGEREIVPRDAPVELQQTIAECWRQTVSKRPTAEHCAALLGESSLLRRASMLVKSR
jgi:hypothetical protein